jgi:sulfate adenylyltransferase
MTPGKRVDERGDARPEPADLLAGSERCAELRARAVGWPALVVSGAALANLEALLAGFLHPLRGYLAPRQHGDAGAAALTLTVPDSVANTVGPGASVALRDAEGVLVAALHVDRTGNDDGGSWLSGAVEGIELPGHDDFPRLRLVPQDIRSRLAALGRARTLAFWPGDLLHAGVRAALAAEAERLDANVLVLIASQPGEHDELAAFARVRALEVSARRLPADRTVIAVVPLGSQGEDAQRRARQRLVARNCGAAFLAVDAGDDTGPAPVAEGRDAAEVVPIRSWWFEPRSARWVPPDDASADAVPPPTGREVLSWTTEAPAWLLDPEEAGALRRAYAPPSAQGFTVLLTGLSGSGKSTLARALRVRLLEVAGRAVTLLDGDRVRRHLSSELGFSREHRDLNILRIGWVAAEITRHGGIVICAPIAPYDAIRQQVRQMVGAAGGFVLVHVSTPLETCEARDRKGLYAKARAGLIPEFTGISDPYEEPMDADLRIDTRATGVDEACDIVMAHLVQKGYLVP